MNPQKEKKIEIIQYLYGRCFRPTLRTFMKAIKNGNFITFPGLNNQKLLKHLSTSIVTYLRHLDQEHKNLQLTKKVKSKLDIEEDKYFYPEIETVNTHDLCTTIIHFNTKRKGFRYLTGALPHKSSRGNLYIMVMYDYYSNAILSEIIENKQAATIHD